MASVADFGSTEANDLTHERRGPSPWVAGLLTVLAPGLGHIYIGEARRGITLFILVMIADTLLMFAMMGCWRGSGCLPSASRCWPDCGFTF
jgi:hypothetical protein